MDGLSSYFGGPSNLNVHPKLANPFNEKRGYRGHSNKPAAGAYRIDQKEILSASVNLDYVVRSPALVANMRKRNKNRN